METLFKAHRPRLCVNVSVLHNPTGSSLSAAAARARTERLAVSAGCHS